MRKVIEVTSPMLSNGERHKLQRERKAPDTYEELTELTGSESAGVKKADAELSRNTKLSMKQDAEVKYCGKDATSRVADASDAEPI